MGIKSIVSEHKYYLLNSGYEDIYHNLAIEKALLEAHDLSRPVLMFYRDNRSVVIGKHQNPWMETDPLHLNRLDIPLARRISGGGTVYHDLGNLNYSIIMPAGMYDRENVLTIIVNAVKRFDLEGEVGNKTSIFAGERKISGNAFCFKHERALHHGTLLVHTDLFEMEKVLESAWDGMKTHAVGSVRSTVTNLEALCEGVTIEDCRESVFKEFEDFYDLEAEAVGIERIVDLMDVEKYYEEFQTNEWILGQTPEFSLQQIRNDAGGEYKSDIKFKKGRVDSVRVFGNRSLERSLSEKLNGLYPHEIDSVEFALLGSRGVGHDPAVDD